MEQSKTPYLYKDLKQERVMKAFGLKVVLFFIAGLLSVQAQSIFPKKHEMRGAWVATVANLDWPTSKGDGAGRFQRDELVGYFDKLQQAGINAIYFQVRSACDAMYESAYDPWSQFLTGEEGVAPSPYWDPLEFAIQEAHKRGMELHAWINPYRALRSVPKTSVSESSGNSLLENTFWAQVDKTSPIIANSNEHVSVTHPDWLLYLGSIAIVNPGMPQVRQYITNVVMEIVNRYDVDGIHFDDYFYPYSPNNIKSEDSETFAEYNDRGFTSIGDWRRDNVNRMIEMVYDSIQTVKPFVKFGISPFGRHSEGYTTLYADAYAWVQGGYLDYLVPQLYWEMSRFYTGTAFQYLYDTWYKERAGKHVYAGHGLYRSDNATFGNTLFSAAEVPNQIRYLRTKGDSTGSLFFRSRNITSYVSKGIADSLKKNFYPYPALTPPMSWKASTKPSSPQSLSVTPVTVDEVITNFTLNWDKVTVPEGNDTTLKYAVYRVTAEQQPTIEEVNSDIRNLIAVTGSTTYTDKLPGTGAPNWYVVTAVNRNSEESDASNFVETEILTSAEDSDVFGLPKQIVLEQNYPNPFNPSTKIAFSVPNAEQLTLKVYDMLGREVAVLANGLFNSGTHSVQFDASRLSSGIYFYTLQTSQLSITKRMVLLK